MSLSFTGKKRINQFLQKDVAKEDRGENGLNGVFHSVFPVRDFSDRAVLEYVSFEFEPPKFDEEECQQRDITFAALTWVISH